MSENAFGRHAATASSHGREHREHDNSNYAVSFILLARSPVSWEQPIEEQDEKKQVGASDNMTTFYDVADDGCLDEVAVQM